MGKGFKILVGFVLFMSATLSPLGFTSKDCLGALPTEDVVETPKPWQSGTGRKTILLLPVEFPDVKHSYNKEYVQEAWKSEKLSSIAKYFEVSSRGKLVVDLGHLGVPDWIMMPQTFEDLKKHARNREQFEDFVYNESLRILKTRGCDLTEYDNDGNGLPDISLLLLAGDESKGMLSDSMYTDDMKSFATVAENADFPKHFTQGIAHELAHVMIPIHDLWDYTHKSNPIGEIDLTTTYFRNLVMGMCGFQRLKAGWVEIEVLDKPGTYVISDINSSGKLYKIPIPGSDSEWILLENRGRSGVDALFDGIQTAGIHVYHVDDKRPYSQYFNSLIGTKNTHGLMFIRQMGFGDKLTGETSPNTLPYTQVSENATKISISNVSKVGPVMTFKLDFEKVKFPIVKTDKKIYMGRIVRNTTKTAPITIENGGLGTLHIQLTTPNYWLTFDRSDFIGNNETVNITVDATRMKYGDMIGLIEYKNLSSSNSDGASGYIEVDFEVVPIPGDIDRNERVNERDFDAFIELYSSIVSGVEKKNPADFNYDGVVDFTDLCILAKNFRPSKN